MPKPYRINPLPKVSENYGLPILKERARVATKRLTQYVSRLDGDFIYEAAVEIGLDECLELDDANGKMTFDLTNLQAVALAAALGALVELRDSAKI